MRRLSQSLPHAVFNAALHHLTVSDGSEKVNGDLSNVLYETPEIIRDEDTVRDDWEHVESLLKNLVNAGVRNLLPLLMKSTQGSNVSATCIKDTLQTIAGIRRLKPWAMRFLDATAKGVDGILSRTGVSFGDYDECIDIVALSQRPGKQYGETMFTGKYCLLHIKPHLPPMKTRYKDGEIVKGLGVIYKRDTVLSEVAQFAPVMYFNSLRLGLCVPSGCSVEDINQILFKATNYMRIFIKVKHCEVKEDPRYTTVMIVVMSVYAFAGFMVLIGTVTDVYLYYSKRQFSSISVQILLAFSLLSNFRKLTKTSTSSKSLRCLNGIRFLTISWVVLGHSYYVMMFNHSSGSINISYWTHTLAYQVILNCYEAVDTFFFLGGFLVCYNGVKCAILRKKNFDIVLYVVRRLWRILPAYVFVILFVFIAELVSSGPTSHNTFKAIREGCEKNWWLNLLFINNFYHPTEVCLEHTWYLAVDMQLYIASLIILFPLFRWPKVGISIAVISLVGSMVTSGAISYMKNLQPTLLILQSINLQDVRNYLVVYYFKPYPHIGPYVTGIITGYFLAVNPVIKIPKLVQLVGWSCAIIFSTSAIYGARKWNAGKEATFWETALYSAFHKTAWGLSIAWMVICCATGHGGIVNHILSWKVWIPLGRLTYLTYLVHYLVQICFVAELRSPIYSNSSTFDWLFFGHLMASHRVAFVGSMLVELPMISLQNVFFSQRDNIALNNTAKCTDHDHTINCPERTGDVTNVTGNLNMSASLNDEENSASVSKL